MAFYDDTCYDRTMQTRREYLVSKGLAKPGRGKFSTLAKEALVKADSEGVVFSDSPSSVPATPVTPTSDAPAPVRADPGNSLYLTSSEYRFPEAEWKGLDTNGKEVSLRECCNFCRVSLVNHSCLAPTIHGNMVVRIVERKVVRAS